jgi:hypothetical protein
MRSLFLSVPLIWPSIAPAGFLTGEELTGICVQPSPACVAYLMGVVDGAVAMEWERVASGFCIPERVDAGEVRTLYLDYVRVNPMLGDMPAAMLVLSALKQAWACDHPP